jgi:hypothetical protein
MEPTVAYPSGSGRLPMFGGGGKTGALYVMVGSVHERDNGHKFAGQAAA